MQDFNNIFSISKTLRFELKITKELESLGMSLDCLKDITISKDEDRVNKYKELKEIIKNYHSKLIEQILNEVKNNFNQEDTDKLNKYIQEYQDLNKSSENKDKSDKKDKNKKSNDIKTEIKKLLKEKFDSKLKEKLSEIKKLLKQNKSKKTKDSAEDENKKDKELSLFGEKILDILLTDGKLSDEDKKVVNEFNKFTTYFKNFSANMGNIYNYKNGSIYYRIVDDNLIQFLKNIKKYNDISEKLSDEEKQQFNTKIKELKTKKIEKLNNNCDNYNVFNDIDSFKYTFTQADIDIYNYIIGGDFDHESKDNKQKEKGINEWINLYNQKQKQKQKDNKDKLPGFTKLRKRILSEVENNQYNLIYSDFDSQEKVLESFEEIYPKIAKKLNNVKNILENINDYDLGKIYINTGRINNISKDYFDDWSKIKDTIFNKSEKNKKSKSKKSLEDKFDEYFKKHPQFSIKEINNYLSDENKNDNLANYYTSDKFKELFDNVKNKYEKIENLLKNIPEKLSQEDITNFKYLLDAIKQINYKIKYLYVTDIIDKDNLFYSSIDNILENDFKEFDKFYNRARNFFTKKPYSTDKFKINFDNQELLKGWDLNKEADYLTILLKKNENYYLGIIPKDPKDKNKKLSKDKKSIIEKINTEDKTANNFYEKMVYKLLPDPKKDIPKAFFAKKSKYGEFNPSEQLHKNYKDKKYLRKIEKNGKIEDNPDFSEEFLYELIDYFKECLNKHTGWSVFNFKFKSTKDYYQISDFYNDIEQQSYKVWFNKVDKNYIHKLVEEKKLFLFQIYNKDFSEYSKGNPNLHTLYFKALFDKNNLENPQFKLNGQAEIFFREKSIKSNKITHPKNDTIPRKQSEGSSKFPYDIIKDKRFRQDKFLFHVPITINNYQADSKADSKTNLSQLNQKVLEYIKNNEVKIIGIDRGERNLLYITLLNSKGEILEQKSLNTIVNTIGENKVEVKYSKLVEEKAKYREEAKQDWSTIGKIKDIKEGYLSNIVHYLAKLIIEKNAILVLENLNLGFKNSRLKIDKQIYSKFEKALITKLNYLVFKDKENHELGGVLKGYQLTNAYEEQRKYNQNGVIFYIPPSYTSKIDPVTGFVNFFKIKYASIDKAKDFISSFDKISFNEELFYFEFDYSKFNAKYCPKYSKKINKSEWEIYSYGDRIKHTKDKNNQPKSEKVNLTEKFKELFDNYDINYKNSNLKDLIVKSEIKEKDFWERLLKLINLTLQLRNSGKVKVEGKEVEVVDYIISPVKDKNGKFYNSSEYYKQEYKLPCDADANGAYNIARKGLMLVDKIKNSKNDEKINLNISNVDWFNFAQQQVKEDINKSSCVNDKCDIV